MRISQTGLALIKHFEGLRTTAYRDVSGTWTIGYGHTGPRAKSGATVSEQEAELLLSRDVAWAEDAVSTSVDVELNQNEFDALVSLVFNIGANGFFRSTCLARLNDGDRTGAADAMLWWNKATIDGQLKEVAGLVRRRADERALFLERADSGGDAPTSEGGDPQYRESLKRIVQWLKRLLSFCAFWR